MRRRTFMMANMESRMGPSSGRSTRRLVTSWWFTYVSRGDHTCRYVLQSKPGVEGQRHALARLL